MKSSSPPNAQARFDVRFDWGEEGLAAVGPGSEVVVIVDVFSFSTAVQVATSQGAAVYPYSTFAGGAAGFAVSRGAILAAHRGAETPERPFTLSPASLRFLAKGSSIVLESPNGAHLSQRAEHLGCRVVVACLRNARAVVARYAGARVAVVAAGERWPSGSLRPAAEDIYGAGAVLSQFPRGSSSPEARAAVGVYLARPDLTRCASALELSERGYDDDIALALEEDVSDVVPVLSDGAYRAA